MGIRTRMATERTHTGTATRMPTGATTVVRTYVRPSSCDRRTPMGTRTVMRTVVMGTRTVVMGTRTVMGTRMATMTNKAADGADDNAR